MKLLFSADWLAAKISTDPDLDCEIGSAPDGIRSAKEKTAMSAFMRAKFQVNKIERFNGQDRVTFNAVARSTPYPEDGSDEDNTYTKFSPSGELSLTIANPALLGAIEPGQKFYLDFTLAK